MIEASGERSLHRLGWRANADGFDVALAVHRLLARGERAWWLAAPRDDAEAGDYVVATSPAQRDALLRMGVALDPWRGDVPRDATPLARPAVRLFAGTASKFPYFAYYALCLLRLGIDYVPCDGAALAGGTLDHANLLILPGGFATWGIDAAENAAGADARVRAFLAEGGAAIGSCGGAYYLSAGRPAWTGTANAKPLYTHEYLQSGVGVVTIALAPGPLARGCAPTMEVPYYHGPIYDRLGDGVEIAATFDALSLSARLAIDNPLDAALFAREMKGKPAILVAEGKRGRAVLFSPHPEMGDLVRRYIALDGYVRHYLPIRGAATMRDTLQHYRVADAPSFRLVLNAVHLLCDARIARAAAYEHDPSRAASDDAVEPMQTCRRWLQALPESGNDEYADLLGDVATGIATRLARIAPRVSALHDFTGAGRSLGPCWRQLASTLAEHAGAADATIAQRLMEADLAVALIECWARVAEMDRALAPDADPLTAMRGEGAERRDAGEG
jgi:hypothetical protein